MTKRWIISSMLTLAMITGCCTLPGCARGDLAADKATLSTPAGSVTVDGNGGITVSTPVTSVSASAAQGVIVSTPLGSFRNTPAPATPPPR